MVTPALTLLATAVASLVVTVVTDSEQASGQVTVTASPAPAAIRAAAVTDGKAISGRAASRLSNAPPVYETESSSGLGAVREHGAEAGPPRVLVETPPGSPPALGPAGHKTLVWSRASDATSYDVELVRDATVIFASRSASARLVLPVSWMWNGVRYAVQPEDQAFVWPVVDGRRAATPVVDGMLVLETTLVARLIAEGQSPANP